jgi:hypothetical protein
VLYCSFNSSLDIILVPKTKQTIQLQIIFSHPPPTECGGVPAHRFGLQDKKSALDLGTSQPDGSRLFTCSIEAKLGGEAPDFSGAVVQGIKGNRFIYLSWAYDEASWAKRFKVSLMGITAEQIRSGSVLQTVIEDGSKSGTVKPQYGWETV